MTCVKYWTFLSGRNDACQSQILCETQFKVLLFCCGFAQLFDKEASILRPTLHHDVVSGQRRGQNSGLVQSTKARVGLHEIMSLIHLPSY